MNDRVFLDTNIIIYAHTDTDVLKQNIAQSIISNNQTVISTQVLQETANTLKRKLNQSYPDISNVLSEMMVNNVVQTNSSTTILKACEIAERFRYSFYDSLIIAAALESGADIRYSEDMSNEHVIDKRLKIVNPFI